MQAEILLNAMSSVPLSYRWFSITWQDGHVGAHNLWLMFCIIIESNSQKTFFSFILCTNMAEMTSGQKHPYLVLVDVSSNSVEERNILQTVLLSFFFSVFIFSMPSKLITAVIQFMFLSIILGPSQSSFSPYLTVWAKISLSRAQTIFMATNINSIALLMSTVYR